MNTNNYDVILIDSEHLLHRSAYANEGMGFMSGEDMESFTPTGAVYGFLSLIPKIWRSYSVPLAEEGGLFSLFDETPEVVEHRKTRIIFCWEGGYKHRTAMFPAYKANRRVEATDPGEREEQLESKEAMKSQRKTLQAALVHLGLTLARAPGFEADDTLGTLAHRFGAEGKKVLVYTGDRDLHQVVTDNVHIAAAQPKGGDFIWTKELVAAEWGVEPIRIPEMKALCGDSGDNIPGCPGCGMGWAKKLMEGTHLDEVLIRARTQLLTGTYEGKSWKASSLTEKIRANEELIRISWELSKVVLDCEVKLLQEPRNREALKDLLYSLKFFSTLEAKNLDRLLLLA